MSRLQSALMLKTNKSMMLTSNPYHSISVEGKKHTSPPQSCLPRKKDYMNARLQTEVNEKHVPTKEQLVSYFERLNEIKKKQKRKQSKKNSINVCLNYSQKQKPKSPQSKLSKFVYRQGATEVGSLIREKHKLKKQRRPTSSSKCKKEQKQQLISILSNLNGCKQNEKLKKSPVRISKPVLNLKKNQLSYKSVCKIKTDMSCLSTVPQTSSVQLFEQIGEGTFGKVYKGRLKNSKKVVAIKRALQDKRCVNRQAEIVGMLDNPFVIRAICNYVTQENEEEYLNIVTEYYSSNLYAYFKQINAQPLISFDLKIIFYQILRGLAYLHSLSICHRDIKPENILLKDKKIAICDFGSAKILVPGETSLPYICSRCYRAPQLMFAATKYTVSIDMWSMGCVMLEALNGKPLFIGENSIDHLIEVIKTLGTPTEEQVLNMNPNYDLDDYNFPNILKKPWAKIFPKADPLLLDLIENIIVYNPKQRLTALEALTHKYFDEIRDKPTSKYIENEFGLKLLSFTKNELKGQEHLEGLLVPDWY